MGEYILTIDEGTTSTRAIILNHEGKWIGNASKEITQFYPDSGWVEHDPVEIWMATVEVIKEAIADAGIQEQEIKAIGITDQRETSIVWDKKTGKPIYKAIVWQDRRTADFCNDLKENGFESMVKKKTGLPIDPFFSGTKVAWILNNVPGAREKAEAGDLYFGTIECWIIWNLTQGKVHATDYSNACRTLMFNINDLKWDDELLNMLHIPKSILPEAKESSGLFGFATGIFKNPIPITGAAGDAQASAFGQCCFTKGMIKFTYGTAGSIDVNIGNKPIEFNNGLTTTIGWGLNGKVTYLAEGTVFCAGATIQWLRDGLKFVESASDTEFFANKVENSGGVYIVPAFTGLGVPYWDAYARGSIFGLSRGTTKDHLIRAGLDSLTYQTKDLFDAASKGLNQKIPLLKVDGGGCRNNLMLQFTADILNVDVERPKNIETTAMGVAYLAGLAIGYWKDLDEIINSREIDRVFQPKMSEEDRTAYYKGWKRAINATLAWSKMR